MTKPTTSLFLDQRRIKKSNQYPVKLTVYYLGDKMRYNSNIAMTTDEWQMYNAKKVRNEDLKLKKRNLDALCVKADKVIEALQDEFSFEEFEQRFFKKHIPKNDNSLERAFDRVIKQLNNEDRIGSLLAYTTAKNSILNYKPNAKLPDVTASFLQEYESVMTKGGYSATTIGIYLRHLRAIINKAIKEGVLSRDKYPFQNYQIPSSRNIKKALSAEDLKSVFEYKPVNQDEDKALDFWILTYLCNGINMTDLLNLTHKSLSEDFISFFRAKTIRTKKRDLRPIKVYVCKEARIIIDKWKSKDEGYLFPVLNKGLTAMQQKNKIQGFLKFVNDNMKSIAEKLKINKPMGTYAARHTHATVLKRKGISIEMISENLGHSSILTTQSYLDSFTDESKRETSKLLMDF